MARVNIMKKQMIISTIIIAVLCARVPLWIIAVIAVIIASVAFLGIFFWNRRQKSFSEMFTGSEDPIN
jgi:hypothetical protein